MKQKHSSLKISLKWLDTRFKMIHSDGGEEIGQFIPMVETYSEASPINNNNNKYTSLPAGTINLPPKETVICSTILS